MLEHETTWTLPVWLEWSMLSPRPVSVLESSIGDASQSVVRLREVDACLDRGKGGRVSYDLTLAPVVSDPMALLIGMALAVRASGTPTPEWWLDLAPASK